MSERRERFELAHTIPMPYHPETMQQSVAQQQADEDESDAADFAEHTMQQYLKSVTGNAFWNELRINGEEMQRKMAALTHAAKQMGDARRQLQKELQLGNDVILADVKRKLLLEVSLKTQGEARLKLLQRWERSKRQAQALLANEAVKSYANEQDAGICKRPQTEIKCTPPAKRACVKFQFNGDGNSPMVTIGPNGTQVSRDSLNAINWNLSGSMITRKLLCEIFGREALLSHTLSGKPSPAFKGYPAKQPLDPLKVADLEHLMTRCKGMTVREVRTAITAKCADENKMVRSRLLQPTQAEP